MGIFKKSVAIVLAALMLFSVMAITATAAAPADGTYYVAGPTELCGDNWKADSEDNVMTGQNGVFTKTYTAVAAGDYQFKITNGKWGNEEGGADWGNGTGNYKFTVTEACDVTITFNTADESITVTGDKVETAKEITIESMAVVGEAGLCGGNGWNPADPANVMTEKDGVYTITLKNIEADAEGYQWKFAANGKWDDSWGVKKDGDTNTYAENELVYNGDNFKTVVEKNSDITFTFDATKMDKATGVGATFKVEFSEPTIETTVEETTEAAEVTTAATEADTTTATEADTTSTEATEADTTSTEATEADTTATEADTTATEADTTATEADTTATEADTTATEAETQADKPIVPGFYVVGSEEACGAEWGWEKPYNYSEPMKQGSDGNYFQVVNNVKASAGNVTDEGPDIFVFKVVYVNEQGGITWHPGGMGNNTKVTVAEDGSTILFQFKLLASKPTKEGSDPEAVIATVYGPNDTKPAMDDPKYPEEATTPATEATTEAPTVAPTEPATDAPKVEKKANTVKVAVTAKAVKVKALKKAKKTVKVATIKVTKAQGKVTVSKVKKGTTAKIYKKVTVTKNGIFFKKGAYKKGTYKVKIKVKAAGNNNYKAKTVTKVATIKVKK